MGKAIVVGLTIVLIAVIIAAVAVYFRRRQSKELAHSKGWAIKGDLNRNQERALIAQIESADTLFRQLLAPPDDLGDAYTFLSQNDRVQVRAWIGKRSELSFIDTRKAL